MATRYLLQFLGGQKKTFMINIFLLKFWLTKSDFFHDHLYFIWNFQNLSYWIEEFNRHCASLPSYNQIPRILVGNKCDLGSDTRVNTNVAQTFADMHQMPLFETSAKDDSRQDHVEAIFMTLALKLKSSKPFYTPAQLHKARVESIDHNNGAPQRLTSDNSGNKSSSSCQC